MSAGRSLPVTQGEGRKVFGSFSPMNSTFLEDMFTGNGAEGVTSMFGSFTADYKTFSDQLKNKRDNFRPSLEQSVLKIDRKIEINGPDYKYREQHQVRKLDRNNRVEGYTVEFWKKYQKKQAEKSPSPCRKETKKKSGTSQALMKKTNGVDTKKAWCSKPKY